MKTYKSQKARSERIYESTKTDPNQSDLNYYGWVRVKNVEIIQIGIESGREGGVTWEPDFNSNGDLETCMKSIARKWPNLYKVVKKFNRGMPTVKEVKREDIEREVNRLIHDISGLEAKLFMKRADLLKLTKA